MINREVIKSCVEALPGNDDEVRARELFEAARSPNYPLHSLFEWDGRKAVVSLGLIRARQLIRSIKLELVVGEERVVAFQFQRDPDLPRRVQGYVSIDALRNDSEKAERCLLQQLRHVEGCLRNMIMLAKACEVEFELSAMMRASGEVRNALGRTARKAG